MSDEVSLAEMTVQTVLERWPHTAKVFNHYSSTCVGCAIAPFCTISDAAKICNLSFEAFIDDLTKAIEGQELDYK